MAIKLTKRGGAAKMSAAVKSAATEAAEAVVSHWHERIMPDHFTVAGGKKYGYAPRRGDNEPPRILVTRKAKSGQVYQTHRNNPHYSWRKRREKRHNKPLVWSGKSEQAAKMQGVIRSKYSPSTKQVKASVGMPLLQNYFYMYRKDLGAPDKAGELTTATPDEVGTLGTVYGSDFDRQLAVLDRPAAAVVQNL